MDKQKEKELAKRMVEEIRHYVDGYKLTVEPMLEHGRIVTMVTVEGHGDYLPPYSGNLDIINCAAISMAERFAEAKL